MGLDVGAVTGALELTSNWDATLQTAAANQQAFETKATASFQGVGASAETAGVRVTAAASDMVASAITLQTKLALAEAGASSAGVEMRTLAGAIVTADTATEADILALTTATTKYLAFKGAVAAASNELKSFAPAAAGASSDTNSLHTSLGAFDSVLAAAGIHIGPEVRGLAELGTASTKTAGELGAVATAGLAIGVGIAAWNITRAIVEFFDLDKAVANAWAKLLGFGDLAGQIAAANADKLARASKLAGTSVTDLSIATSLLNASVGDFRTNEEKSTASVAGWHAEIAKVKAAGDLPSLTKDLASHNFALTDLKDRYGVSVEAMQVYQRETTATATAEKAATDSIHASNARKLEDLKSEIADRKAAIEATQKFTGAMTELNSSGVGWKGTLDTIDGAVVEAIKGYLQAGVSQSALAIAYGLTGTQVKAVSSELANEKSKVDAVAEGVKKAEDAHKEFAAAMVELNSAGKGWQGTLDTIDGTVVEAIKFYLQAGVAQAALATAYGLTDAQVKAVASSMRDAGGHAKTFGDALVTAGLTGGVAVQMLGVHFGELTKAERAASLELNQFNDLTTKAQELARKAGGSIDYSTPGGVGQDPELVQWLHGGYSVAQASALVFAAHHPGSVDPSNPIYSQAPGPRLPGYASGVVSAPGGWSTVGERGPEQMYVPQGATIFPAGAGGGGQAPVMHISIAVNGVLDSRTTRELSEKVGDAFMKRWKQTMQFGAAG